MLDIHFIREHPDLVREAARKKRVDFNVDELLDADSRRRELLANIEPLRARMNVGSEAVAAMTDAAEREKAIAGLRAVKRELEQKEARLKKVYEEWRALMFRVPNIPDPSVPEGATDAENQEIRRWPAPSILGEAEGSAVEGGERPQFSFTPKDHLLLMRNLALADTERGASVAGFRGYFLTNEAVLLSLALWHFAVEKLTARGFTPVIAPSLVGEESLVGTAWLPQGKDEVYQTQDKLYLSGTAEAPMMGYYRDEVLEAADLPKRYVAFSPCFRREAGSYGKDTKGLLRVHEFMKVEQVVLCKADHEESVRLHEEITKNAEELMQALELPYRVVINASGDMGLGQVKKYDIETWLPSENRYRETHSSSYFHDFQTRRLNIRYRDQDGKLHFAHSLNNTALATPRLLAMLLENNQQEDGSVRIPKVLQPYVGKAVIAAKKIGDEVIA